LTSEQIDQLECDLLDVNVNPEFGTILWGFQNWAHHRWHTMPWKPKQTYTADDRYIMSTGLGGEAGEVLEVLKKGVRDGRRKSDPEGYKEDLVLELGDVLYYAAQIATENGISLEEVIKKQVEKSKKRREKKLRAKKKVDL
jgi:NTP pyrophosphatase (non-canonical NTP hydrolase)